MSKTSKEVMMRPKKVAAYTIETKEAKLCKRSDVAS